MCAVNSDQFPSQYLGIGMERGGLINPHYKTAYFFRSRWSYMPAMASVNMSPPTNWEHYGSNPGNSMSSITTRLNTFINWYFCYLPRENKAVSSDGEDNPIRTVLVIVFGYCFFLFLVKKGGEWGERSREQSIFKEFLLMLVIYSLFFFFYSFNSSAGLGDRELRKQWGNLVI